MTCVAILKNFVLQNKALKISQTYHLIRIVFKNELRLSPQKSFHHSKKSSLVVIVTKIRKHTFSMFLNQISCFFLHVLGKYTCHQKMYYCSLRNSLKYGFLVEIINEHCHRHKSNHYERLIVGHHSYFSPFSV